MTDILPHTIDLQGDNNWAAIHLAMCYRPHTPIPTKEELMSLEPYQLTGHVSMKEITKQIGLNLVDEIQKRQ